MKDWIPLLQSLIWPVFIAVLAIRFRRPLGQPEPVRLERYINF